MHVRGPPRGFGDSGRRAIYFKGFGEKGHLFSGIWGESMGAGSRGMRKNILGSWGERSFFFQGAGSKDPPPPEGPHVTIYVCRYVLSDVCGNAI